MLTSVAISENVYSELEGNFEYQSMTSANGVRFSPTKEAALDPALRALARSLPRSSPGVVMMAEVPGPVGIPDLLALPGSGARLARRLDSKIPPVLRQVDIEILTALRVRQGITMETVKSRVNRADRTIYQSLRNLCGTGAAVTSGRLFYRAESLEPVGNIYALEAKVDDWKKGVRQAFRYRAWCNASALVLSRIPKDRVPLISAAQRLSIGLAWEDQWIVRPKICKLDRVHRLWGSEHFVAALGFTPTKYPQL